MSDLTPPFQLSLPFFEGSVDDLVRIVGLKKVLPADVPVAQVVSQFSAFVREMDEVDLDQFGEFMAASARLMVLKSAQLLLRPVAEDADLIDEVSGMRGADRELYAAIAARLSRREGLESFTPLAAPQLVDRAVEPRSPNVLVRMWNEIASRDESPSSTVLVPAFVRLETAVSGLIRRLKTRARLSLRGLLRGVSRQDAVVHFLAVLEVVRTRQATVMQDAPFDDITVEYAENEADFASRAG